MLSFGPKKQPSIIHNQQVFVLRVSCSILISIYWLKHIHQLSACKWKQSQKPNLWQISKGNLEPNYVQMSWCIFSSRDHYSNHEKRNTWEFWKDCWNLKFSPHQQKILVFIFLMHKKSVTMIHADLCYCGFYIFIQEGVFPVSNSHTGTEFTMDIAHSLAIHYIYPNKHLSPPSAYQNLKLFKTQK